MKWMTFVFAALVSLTLQSTAFAQTPQDLTASGAIRNAADLTFTYEPYEGDGFARCTHVRWEQSPFDWDVTCVDASGRTRTFVAHLALSRYTHGSGPVAVTYELLYWVNGNGASTWTKYAVDPALVYLESSQSITGEEATLRLKITHTP